MKILNKIILSLLIGLSIHASDFESLDQQVERITQATEHAKKLWDDAASTEGRMILFTDLFQRASTSNASFEEITSLIQIARAYMKSNEETKPLSAVILEKNAQLLQGYPEYINNRIRCGKWLKDLGENYYDRSTAVLNKIILDPDANLYQKAYINAYLTTEATPSSATQALNLLVNNVDLYSPVDWGDTDLEDILFALRVAYEIDEKNRAKNLLSNLVYENDLIINQLHEQYKDFQHADVSEILFAKFVLSTLGAAPYDEALKSIQAIAQDESKRLRDRISAVQVYSETVKSNDYTPSWELDILESIIENSETPAGEKLFAANIFQGFSRYVRKEQEREQFDQRLTKIGNVCFEDTLLRHYMQEQETRFLLNFSNPN